MLLDIIKIGALPDMAIMTPGQKFGAIIYFLICGLKFGIITAIYLYQQKEDQHPTAFAFSQMPADGAGTGGRTRLPSERAHELWARRSRSRWRCGHAGIISGGRGAGFVTAATARRGHLGALDVRWSLESGDRGRRQVLLSTCGGGARPYNLHEVTCQNPK